MAACMRMTSSFVYNRLASSFASARVVVTRHRTCMSRQQQIQIPAMCVGARSVHTSCRRNDDADSCRFPLPDRKTLPEDLQEAMDVVEEKSGFLPNVFKAYSYHPDSFRAFFQYHNMLMVDSGNLTKADKELIVVATSAANNCMYCIVAHGALHRVYSKNPVLADQVAANWRAAELDDRQRAILDLAMAVCTNEPITDAHFANLQAHGLDRDDAFQIGSVAAFFALSNRMAHLFDMKPNKEFHLLGRVPREKK
ncbi:uncharacterized protein [Diadema antillarum]|uniref:uncharacterized protein n=1 Tax=Diadema antillarum TaxID=105358 RepID=UPI003A848166